MNILIETERLKLRQFSEDDAEPLSAICNQPNVLEWMPDWEGTIQQRKEWIAWAEGQYGKANKDIARVLLAVILKE
jgi:ribosomal-protein-alanine N-acetyltransferase